MKINSEFAAFVSSNVMIVLGSRDHLLMPDIARAVGAVVHAEEGCIDLLISEWQWPNTVANVRANGQMSVTFARPSDYVSYQAKGFAEVIRAKAEYIFAAQRYTASMTSTLTTMGISSTSDCQFVLGLYIDGLFEEHLEHRGEQGDNQ